MSYPHRAKDAASAAVLVAVLAAALVPFPVARPAEAQQPGTATPVPPADVSRTEGLSLGLYSSTTEVVLNDVWSETAHGLAARVGYGVSHGVEFFAEFALAVVERPAGEEGDDHWLTNLDAGFRYNFRRPTRQVRPYLFAAMTHRGDDNSSLDFGTARVTWGAGLRWYVTAAFAIDGNVAVLDSSPSAPVREYVRSNVGVSWHP